MTVDTVLLLLLPAVLTAELSLAVFSSCCMLLGDGVLAIVTSSPTLPVSELEVLLIVTSL